MAQSVLEGSEVERGDRSDVAKVKERTAKADRLSKALPDKVHTWPYLVRLEMMVGTALMAFMTIWAILVDAPLEEPANPTKTPNPSKAPWYFLGLQELLVYFDAWFAGVVLPAMIIVGLMVIPYVDINPKGNGYYCFKERWFAVSFYLFGFVVLWISTVIIGTFFRGPGWYMFTPGEYWDVHKTVAITNVDWPTKFGITGFWPGFAFGAASVVAFLFGPPAVFWKLKSHTNETLKKLGPVRYWIVAFFVMSTAGVVVKMILRLGFNVKNVMVGPMGFNI
ncbi:MAG: cytochrome C [Deltaproteobacteria bacterium]|nr:cytochrome C [Deltaproteobacteria bacterium]